MSQRHGMFFHCHGCEECRAASRACLLYPFRWARDEIREWGAKEWIVAVYIAALVCMAWYWRNL